MTRKLLRFVVYNTTKKPCQWFWKPLRKKARTMYHQPKHSIRVICAGEKGQGTTL